MDAVTPATALVEKRRTITLTNRAPISIIEDEWPVIAQGQCGEDAPDGSPYQDWDITIRVRVQKKGGHRALIHANYKYHCDADEEWHQARVGRLMDVASSRSDHEVWKTILEVGDELRERMQPEGMRKYVTYALDACFAQLPPRDSF